MAKYRIIQKVNNFAYPKPLVEYFIEKRTLFGWVDEFGERPGVWRTYDFHEAQNALSLLMKNTKWACREVIVS